VNNHTSHRHLAPISRCRTFPLVGCESADEVIARHPPLRLASAPLSRQERELGGQMCHSRCHPCRFCRDHCRFCRQSATATPANPHALGSRACEAPARNHKTAKTAIFTNPVNIAVHSPRGLDMPRDLQPRSFS